MLCRLKDCGKCGGDLFLDFDEWRCFQCGRIYYPQRPSIELLLEPMEDQHLLAADVSRGEDDLDCNGRRARRSPRSINAVLSAKSRSEEKWWARNKQVIHHLDMGNSVGQIAEMVGRGARQVRLIRERLYELRATALEPMAAD